MSSSRITYTPHPGITPEGEVSALAAIYKFVLFGSQTSKGGPDDLTKDSIKECTTSQDKKGTQNADLHGNRL
jgi:hypothetical protein